MMRHAPGKLIEGREGIDKYLRRNYIVDSEEKQIINRLPFNPLINTDQMQQLEAEDAGVQFSHTDSIRTIQRAHDDEASHTIGASRKDAGAFLRTGCEKHVNEMSKEVMQ